jgi:predicted phosphodiesterase
MQPWHPLVLDVDDAPVDRIGARVDGLAPGPSVHGRPLLCLSDIHGDLAALESVLDAVAHVPLSGIVVAGDLCLGGPAPFLVWQRLRELGAHLVRGPTDLALGTLVVDDVTPRNAREEARLLTFLRTREALGEIVCRRLAELPTTTVVSLDDATGVMVLHGSPVDEYTGLLDDEHLAQQVDCVAEDVLVTGCTHRAFGRWVEREPQPLLVVNAGSVGASPVRQDGRRTAHAVLLVPGAEGRVIALGNDVPIDDAHAKLHAQVRRVG